MVASGPASGSQSSRSWRNVGLEARGCGEGELSGRLGGRVGAQLSSVGHCGESAGEDVVGALVERVEIWVSGHIGGDRLGGEDGS